MCFKVVFCFALVLCLFNFDPVFGLRYEYGDGTYYVGNVDTDGKPFGRGQFYNSSGTLGESCSQCYKHILAQKVQETYLSVLASIMIAGKAYFT